MIKEAAEEIGSDDLIIQLNEADTNKFKKDLSSQGSDSFELEGIKFTSARTRRLRSVHTGRR